MYLLRCSCKKTELPKPQIFQIRLAIFFMWCNGLPDIHIKINAIADKTLKVMRINFLSISLFFFEHLHYAIIDLCYAFLKSKAISVENEKLFVNGAKIFMNV